MAAPQQGVVEPIVAPEKLTIDIEGRRAENTPVACSLCLGIQGLLDLRRSSQIEHQKGPMGLCIRTIGIARARVKIGLANLTYNIRRLVFQERRPLAA